MWYFDQYGKEVRPIPGLTNNEIIVGKEYFCVCSYWHSIWKVIVDSNDGYSITCHRIGESGSWYVQSKDFIYESLPDSRHLNAICRFLKHDYPGGGWSED